MLFRSGQPISDASALRERIRRHRGDAAQQWQVDRAGAVLALDVRPRQVEEGGQTSGRIDAMVGRPPEMLTVRLGPLDGLMAGLRQVRDTAALSLRMMGRMILGEASVKNLSAHSPLPTMPARPPALASPSSWCSSPMSAWAWVC